MKPESNLTQGGERASEHYDVAVIGYGPTGLVAASMLGRAGYRVVVIERWPTPYGLPRLTHIDGETARIVQASSDVEQALRNAMPVDSYHYRDAAGDLLLELNWTGRACGYPAHISIYQPDIEDAIDARASGYRNVTVLRGWEVETLKQTDDGVVLSAHPWRAAQDAQWTEPPRDFQVSYAIGADGANSVVRRTLGIERNDFGYNERWLNLDSENLADLGAACETTTIFCDPARAYMHMPIGTRRTRFELRVLPGEATSDWEAEEAGWRWLKERYGYGPEHLKMLRHVVYTFETRMAERWREDRVLLAGDAAHTMMPYMGQGACSGMRDGINLAWKLDLVLSGRAAPSLLDTYETERKPHVNAIMQMSLFLGQVVNEDDPHKVAERDAAFRAGKVPSMPPFPKVEHGIVHREADGTLLPATGIPAPQGRVRQGAAEGRLDDVVGYGFQIVAREHPAQHLDAGQLEFVAQLGGHFAVLSDNPNGRDAIVDHEGDQRAFMDAHGIQAYISRPDFVVFGAVADMQELGALVDDLREKLHWLPKPASADANFSVAGVRAS
jgi:3-(3-hydroxy-phenyl)propionate hydroxylase